MFFEDRRDAGRRLGDALRPYARRPEVLVLALPRGGVPVAYEVACALQAPLHVFVVRKLGVPGQEELAMGAIASGGVRVLNPEAVHALGIRAEEIERAILRQLPELERQEREYRGTSAALEVRDRTVILIDDGLATGSTMRAAVGALRQRQPARIVVAVPVAPEPTCTALREIADEVVCLSTPEDFSSVGQWYRCFDQTTDEEVRHLLNIAQGQARQGRPA